MTDPINDPDLIKQAAAEPDFWEKFTKFKSVVLEAADDIELSPGGFVFAMGMLTGMALQQAQKDPAPTARLPTLERVQRLVQKAFEKDYQQHKTNKAEFFEFVSTTYPKHFAAYQAGNMRALKVLLVKTMAHFGSRMAPEVGLIWLKTEWVREYSSIEFNQTENTSMFPEEP